MAIAKMIRVFMVGASVHKEETMRFLQRAGVVHLEPVVPLAGDPEKQASAALLRLRRVGQIEQAVNRYRRHEQRIPADCPDEELVAYAEEALNAFRRCRNRRQALERLAEDLAPWGDFDLEGLRRLEENGVYVQRWRMERKKSARSESFPMGFLPRLFRKSRGFSFIPSPWTDPSIFPAPRPCPGRKCVCRIAAGRSTRLRTEEETLAARLAGIALRADVLKAQVTAALNEARYLEQMGTLYAEEYLFGLQGWIPADIAADLLRQVEAKRLPLQVEVREPLPEEEPPILYENNWFIRRIEPLLKLYGNPKYRDLDPSYFFAPFMILFFGICLGDAGYGVVFYLVAHVMGKKWGEKVEGLPTGRQALQGLCRLRHFRRDHHRFRLRLQLRQSRMDPPRRGRGRRRSDALLLHGPGSGGAPSEFLLSPGDDAGGFLGTAVSEAGTAVRSLGRRPAGRPEHLVCRTGRGAEPAPDLGRIRRPGSGAAADPVCSPATTRTGGSAWGWVCGASTA